MTCLTWSTGTPSAEVPDAKMVDDLTYMSTWQGWMYLAVVIDCARRAVIGWAIDRHDKTTLVQRAIRMAADRVNLPDGAIFHSDRGSNYTSGEFAATLAELGIRQSVGSTGDGYDNAVAASFVATPEEGTCAPYRVRHSQQSSSGHCTLH